MWVHSTYSGSAAWGARLAGATGRVGGLAVSWRSMRPGSRHDGPVSLRPAPVRASGWPQSLPASLVHDVVEGAAVRVPDRRQRSVGRIAQGDQPDAAAVPRMPEDAAGPRSWS